jgi:hypothetical protein
MEYADEDAHPPLEMRVCGECSNALGGFGLARRLRAEFATAGPELYARIPDPYTMTDTEARQFLHGLQGRAP